MTTRQKSLLAVMCVFIGAETASAIDFGFGLFKRRRANSNNNTNDPVQKIKQHIATLESDPDVDHRKSAAEALRGVDPRLYTDVLPALISSLQEDPSADLRAIVAESIASIKAVSPAAAEALTAVEKNDPSPTVRAAAKAALWQYQLNGYKPTATLANRNQTSEPPLAAMPPTIVPPPSVPSRPSTYSSEVQFRPITQGPGKAAPFAQTTEPPLAKITPTELPTPSEIIPKLPKPANVGSRSEPPPIQIPVVPAPVIAPPLSSVPSIPTGVPTIMPPPGVGR